MPTAATNPALTQILLGLGLSVMTLLAWQVNPLPIMPIIIGVIPLALLIVLGQPFLTVLLFVLFSFFRIHEVFPALYPLRIPLLLSAAAIAALIWHVGLTRRITPYWRTELTMVAVFFALVTLGVMFASNRPVAITYFKAVYWKIALMTFAIAWLTRTPKDFSLASFAITIAGGLVAVVALNNKFKGIGLVEETRVTIGRALGSVLGDPNDLALVLMFPAAFAVSFMLTKALPMRCKIIGIMTTPLLFSAVIATQSRGGLLGMLAVFFVFGFRRIQSKILFISMGATLALSLFAAAGISGRASGGAAEAGLDASAQGRLYAWEAAFGMATDNPFTGVGIDNFYSNYYFYSPHWDGLNHAVHSTWFGILAETGFLGLFVFVLMMIVLLKSANKTLQRLDHPNKCVSPIMLATAEAVYAGLIGTIVSGTFLTQGFTWPIYILAALVTAVAQWAKENA